MVFFDIIQTFFPEQTTINYAIKCTKRKHAKCGFNRSFTLQETMVKHLTTLLRPALQARTHARAPATN